MVWESLRGPEAGQLRRTQGYCQEEPSPRQRSPVLLDASLGGTLIHFTDWESEVQRGCTLCSWLCLDSKSRTDFPP